MNYGFLWIKVFFLLGDVCLQILHSSPKHSLAWQYSLPQKINCKCKSFQSSGGNTFFKSFSVCTTFFPEVSPHL